MCGQNVGKSGLRNTTVDLLPEADVQEEIAPDIVRHSARMQTRESRTSAMRLRWEHPMR